MSVPHDGGRLSNDSCAVCNTHYYVVTAAPVHGQLCHHEQIRADSVCAARLLLPLSVGSETSHPPSQHQQYSDRSKQPTLCHTSSAVTDDCHRSRYFTCGAATGLAGLSGRTVQHTTSKWCALTPCCSASTAGGRCNMHCLHASSLGSSGLWSSQQQQQLTGWLVC